MQNMRTNVILSMAKLLRYCCCILLVFNFFSVNSQRDTTTLLIQELYGHWKDNYKKYAYDHLAGDRQEVKNLFYDTDSDTITVNNFIVELKKAEAKVYKSDLGVDFLSGFMHNLSPGEADFDNIIYNSRFTSEVAWNVLRSGFVHNQIRAQILENESKIAAIENEELQKSAAFAIRWNKIIYLFNLKKIEVLDRRMQLAEKRIDVVKKLYFLNKVNQEELLKNMESLAEIRSMYKIYKDFNDQLNNQYKFYNEEPDYLPLIDLDYDYIIDKLDGQNNDEIIALASEIIDKKNHFINDLNFKTFVRYSYYDLAIVEPSSRDFVSVGVSLGVPLNFNRRYKNELMSIQKQELEIMPEDERIIIEKDILNNYYEFRYKRKQFTSLHYKKLLYKELLRKQSARFSVDYLSFNPVQSLRIMDDMMKIDIEMLDLKQQMYLKLLAIHVDLPYNNIDELFNVKKLDDDLDKIYAAQRSIYIWDRTFDNHTPSFLLSYFEKQEFSGAVIAFGQNRENFEKKLAFIDTLNKNDTPIEIMIGKNSMIDDENPQLYLIEITEGVDLSIVSAIHLDVEPHTFDDWQERKIQYLEQYIQLLERVRVFCDQNNLNLSVSIPLHYPVEYTEKIYELCDLIYFMAYENVKTDYIVRKVSDFPAEKTVIALRTEDFSSPLGIEQKIIDIQQSYMPAHFIIHDIKRLIEMERR